MINNLPFSIIDDGFVITNPILTDAGFETGDKIITVDGQKLDTYSDLRKSIIGSTNYQVERNGSIIEIQLPVDFLGKLSSSDDECCTK